MLGGVSLLGIGLVGILIQGTFLKVILPPYLVPHLLLILVAFIASHRPTPVGAFYSFILGLEYDLFASGTLLGPSGASFVICFGLISLVSQRLFWESYLTVSVVVFVGALLNALLYLAIVSQFSQGGFNYWIAARAAIFEGIVTALIAPVVFGGLSKIAALLKLIPREGEIGVLARS